MFPGNAASCEVIWQHDITAPAVSCHSSPAAPHALRSQAHPSPARACMHLARPACGGILLWLLRQERPAVAIAELWA